MRHFILMFLCVYGTAVAAQSGRQVVQQQHGWLAAFSNVKLGGKWVLFTDLQLRRAEQGRVWQQWMVRLGLLYSLPNNCEAGGGYAYIYTYPYGKFPAARNFMEHRAWQQFSVSQKWGGFAMVHRYRLEQRWIESTSDLSPGRYENRIRYMLRLSQKIRSRENRSLYLFASDEVMLNFGREVARNTFDQNRLSAGPGYQFSESFRIEGGYMFHAQMLRLLNAAGDNRFENNHTAIVNLFFKF